MFDPNGEIEVRGFGASLTARGLSVVAVIVLLAGLTGVLVIDWLGWRMIAAQHQEWETRATAHAASRLDQLEKSAQEHRSLEQKFDAMIYVQTLSQEERARLKLKEPPALRALLDSR
jgi:hypothetical protein